MLTRYVPRVLAGLFLCLTVLLTGCSPHTTGASPPAPSWAGHMATVKLSRLPAEARGTLALIDKGGPFPYAQDGVVFGNFERLLPRHRRGYYHEYTVRTPGSRDRGARRIVTGQGGEIYYTGDHYKSFRAVLR
ncbi:ribonuclease domain-containing protein [Streptomyces yaanensis]|uniref:Ribonuclease domain-containing protein n=1 Tax=Streptomyces yaanensis TaxID=1142239 RepID=A0ABV7S7M5_9ACTN|nr:ribonuclease domain-containing protein [Streptomyces sp. CGMCC 4.7035]WNC00640.1 ribonuclease domain-containing protein [Streptomyces sp. CGMCC 4.7035]